MADPTRFLTRWSRLKRSATRRRKPAPVSASSSEPAAQQSADAAIELPPIESLTKDSDIAPFLRSEVPQGLRNAALRKLWASDPVYANLDGLVEYGEDFGEPFRLATAVATVYRVLEGMPDLEPKTPDEPPATPPAAESGNAAASATQADGRKETDKLD